MRRFTLPTLRKQQPTHQETWYEDAHADLPCIYCNAPCFTERPICEACECQITAAEEEAYRDLCAKATEADHHNECGYCGAYLLPGTRCHHEEGGNEDAESVKHTAISRQTLTNEPDDSPF